MKKSIEIIGLPVISITEGRELGMSKTLLIDSKNGTIAAITIEDEDVPLADVPKTGDLSILWIALSAVSVAGYLLLSRKKETQV